MLLVLALTRFNWARSGQARGAAQRSFVNLSPVLLKAVTSAAENHHVAETVLLTNWLMHDVSLDKVNPADLASVIKALDQIGQSETAKAFAQEVVKAHLMQMLLAEKVPDGTQVRVTASVNVPDPLIDGFLQAISAMRAASVNTLSAYRQDLLDCQAGLEVRAKTLANCNMDDLRGVIIWWHQRDLKPRSVARRISALRQFMGWAVEDGVRQDNPTTWLDNPSLPASVPKSLSEIIQLLKMATMLEPKSASLQALAMLEILYATGLRVSELVSLLVVQFRRNPKTILVKGKGGVREWFRLVKLHRWQRFAGLSAVMPILHLCSLIICFRCVVVVR